MFFDYKKVIFKFILFLSICNLIGYVAFHIYYVSVSEFWNNTTANALYIIYDALSQLIKYLNSTLCAIATLILYSKCGKRCAILGAIAVSASTLLFSIPYYYIYYIGTGYDSVESIINSLLVSVLMVLTTALHSLLLCLIPYLVMRSKDKNADMRKTLDSDFTVSKVLDTSSVWVKASFAICIGEAIFLFIFEVIDTVTFFIDYGMTYRIDEILYIVLSYIILLPIFALSHRLCIKFKNYTVKNCVYKIEKEQ